MEVLLCVLLVLSCITIIITIAIAWYIRDLLACFFKGAAGPRTDAFVDSLEERSARPSSKKLGDRGGGTDPKKRADTNENHNPIDARHAVPPAISRSPAAATTNDPRTPQIPPLPG